MDKRKLDITLLVPTLGERPEMLKTLIESVGDKVKVKVLDGEGSWLSKVNEACKDLEGYMLLAPDDSEFVEGSIDKAVEAMQDHFPDGDGVIAFNQVNLPSSTEWGIMLIGSRFLDRFQDRKPFCPDYNHYFADEEFGLYAIKEGKFIYCEDVHVKHYHFSVIGKKDSTALKSRGLHFGDEKTNKSRNKRGWLWGENFDLESGGLNEQRS